jgi:hypothetical protein
MLDTNLAFLPPSNLPTPDSFPVPPPPVVASMVLDFSTGATEATVVPESVRCRFASALAMAS